MALHEINKRAIHENRKKDLLGFGAAIASIAVLGLKTKGDPPTLPGRQQKFDGSGSLVLAPYRPPSSDCRQPQAIEGRSYVQTLLRSGLLLLCDCDQAPLRGQQS